MRPQDHPSSRRDFLKTTAATGVVAAGVDLFAPRPATAHDSDVPEDTGRHRRRYIIRGGSVLSMDPGVGDFAQADVLVEGKKILAVGPHLRAGGATVIDAPDVVVAAAVAGGGAPSVSARVTAHPRSRCRRSRPAAGRPGRCRRGRSAPRRCA